MNEAKKQLKQISRDWLDRNEAQGPVAGGGSPAAQGRSSVFSDDSDDDRLSPTVNDAMVSLTAVELQRVYIDFSKDFLKTDFQSLPPRNDRFGIRGTSFPQPGVLLHSGSGRETADASEVKDTIEPVNSAKRKRTFSGAETSRAPPVPGFMLQLCAADPSAQRPPSQRSASQTRPDPSSTLPAGGDRQATGDKTNPDSQVVQGHTTLEMNSMEANKPTDDKPAHHIFYNIVIHRKTRSLRTIWVDGKIGNHTVRKFFEVVASRVGLADIQRMKFTLRGKHNDNEAFVDRNDDKAFEYMQRSWKACIRDEMKKNNFEFDVDLEIDLASVSDREHREVDLDISL